MGTKLKKFKTKNMTWFANAVLSFSVVMILSEMELNLEWLNVYSMVIVYLMGLFFVVSNVILITNLTKDSADLFIWKFFEDMKMEMFLIMLVSLGIIGCLLFSTLVHILWRLNFASFVFWVLNMLVSLVMIIPLGIYVETLLVIFVRRVKNSEKRKQWVIAEKIAARREHKNLEDKKTEKLKCILRKTKVRYETAYSYEKKQMHGLVILCVIDVLIIILCLIAGIYFNSSRRVILILLAMFNAGYCIYQTKSLSDFSKLIRNLHQIAEGEKTDIGLLPETSPYHQASEDIKKVQNVMNQSVQRQVKSEQMKVDLITNVSHDLKTPLTSMIGYIDLLKKEELTPEARDYVEMLAVKSECLKDMIQDLFEISKATSGNAALNLEKLNMEKLLEQTLADLNDRIESSGFEIRKHYAEETLEIMGDGKKLYRVYQNLIENALKYAMPGTRIYIDAYLKDEYIETVIKNVAAYEMNFTGDKIVERFQRGDDSRTTEGHGLGLAIAKSFSEACGGRMEVIIDGDIFKVVILYPVFNENKE